MNALRFIWKHRGGLGFLLFVGLVLGGVALLSRAQKAQTERDAAVVAPSVLAANRVDEKEPNDTIGQPQTTKVSLGLDTWVSLSGKFDSDTDKDRFRLGVGAGVNGYEVQTWYDQGGALRLNAGLLGINRFPITMVSYDSAGKVLGNQLLAASGGGSQFPAGTVTVEIVIFGQSDQGAAYEPYRSNKPYSVFLKGRFKEPTKNVAAQPQALSATH